MAALIRGQPSAREEAGGDVECNSCLFSGANGCKHCVVLTGNHVESR